MRDKLPIFPRALLRILWVGAWLGLGSTLSAHAKPARPPGDPCLQDKVCRDHVDTARTMSGAGLLAEALKEYEAAYARRPTPWLLFNLARLLDRMDRAADAVPLYQRYIDAMGGEDSEQVRTARVALADAQAKRSAAGPTVTPPPAPPPMTTPPPVATPPPLVTPAAAPKSGSGISGPLAAGFLLGGGLALLGAGLGFGHNAKQVETSLISSAATYDQRLFDRGESLNRTAIGLDVVGGVIAAAGAVVTIVIVARRDRGSAATATSARVRLGSGYGLAGGL